ncbi:Syntaxin-72-like protein [Drosera capensis]
MSLIDILFRVDQICKKYEKYDIDKQRQLNANSDDPFARLDCSIESGIDAASYKTEAIAMERDRAKAVAMNAEIRRTKARLMEEMPKLQKLACKKVLSKEDMETRNEIVFALADRIKAIPDGATAAAAKTSGWGASEPRTKIKFDMESRQFRQGYEMRKAKQVDKATSNLKKTNVRLKENLHQYPGLKQLRNISLLEA